MKFRKLYWVTEQVGEDGLSEVIGVFTSIYDLQSKGVRWDEGSDKRGGLRVSLVKLDAACKPFGTWQSPGFDGMREELQQFIDTREFDAPAVDDLVRHLQEFK